MRLIANVMLCPICLTYLYTTVRAQGIQVRRDRGRKHFLDEVAEGKEKAIGFVPHHAFWRYVWEWAVSQGVRERLYYVCNRNRRIQSVDKL